MNPISTSDCLAHAPLVPTQPWLHRVAEILSRVSRSWRSRPMPRAPAGLEPPAPDLGSLAQLSDAVLRDIGVSDGLRAEAAQRREQAALLRQLELHRGNADLMRW